MATIGTFTKKSDSSYQGAIATLAFKASNVVFVPVDKTNEDAPDFRVLVGNVEIGAAWDTESKRGTRYLSVKLDDPKFPAPIYCRLVETERSEQLQLIWNR